MDAQRRVVNMGGTMRLGAQPCELAPGSFAREAYGQDRTEERHRHRYEFNNAYRERFEEKGMRFAGLSPDGKLVEIIELRDHPWFVAVQFHPELTSRPVRAHPLFAGLVRAALERRRADALTQEHS
jgi:CTP synthase